jgi:putative hydrolase of the HAD superfamily
MKTYQHLFFDLDHTLWDFEKNSEETIIHLFEEFNLARFGDFTCTDFYKKYSYVNKRLWQQYNAGKIKQQELRDTRFKSTLVKLGVKDALVPAGLDAAYISLCPTKTAVFPFTHETLSYLQSKYELHIITNGFKESQYLKMASSDLHRYFKEIITSECSGCTKPNRQMFEYALNKTNVSAAESLMIGDNLEADILGAKNAGIDQVFFNPERKRHNQKVTYEISCLSELMDIL